MFVFSQLGYRMGRRRLHANDTQWQKHLRDRQLCSLPHRVRRTRHFPIKTYEVLILCQKSVHLGQQNNCYTTELYFIHTVFAAHLKVRFIRFFHIFSHNLSHCVNRVFCCIPRCF